MTVDEVALAAMVELTVSQQPEMATAQAVIDSAALDLAMWQAVGAEEGVQGLLRYLERFPEGEFAAIARDRIAALAAVDSKTERPVANFDADTAVELTFWKSVQASDNPEMYQAYLDKYPDGEFVSLARIRLNELLL